MGLEAGVQAICGFQGLIFRDRCHLRDNRKRPMNPPPPPGIRVDHDVAQQYRAQQEVAVLDWVQGSGIRVKGLGFRVQGSGFRLQASGFRVQGLGFRV